MLKVENLSVYFGDFVAVKNVSFDVRAGEIFGLLGANGAGKTTTIRVLCGLLNPSEGMVQIGSTRFGKNDDKAEEIKSRIGYMSQKFTLYDDLTIDENWEFTASLRQMSRKTFRERRDYLNEWLSLGDKRKKLVGSLPSGLKQQVALAAALFHNPDLIFLDEPTAGVSPYARFQFWSLIKKLASEGKAIIVTTHYMDEAENCERLALMRAGEVIALDVPAALKKSTFPHKLWRLHENHISSQLHQAFERLKTEKKLNFWACGLNYHVVFESLELWEKLSQEFKELELAERVDPSLEDVFLELVEGRGR